jgi:hypothetical protein
MGFKALPVFGSVNVDLSEGRKILAQSGFSSASIALVCALSDWEQWAAKNINCPSGPTAQKERPGVSGGELGVRFAGNAKSIPVGKYHFDRRRCGRRLRLHKREPDRLGLAPQPFSPRVERRFTQAFLAAEHPD